MFEDLIPELQEAAQAIVNAASDAGLLPRVTSTRRTRTAQERLYRRFLSGLSPLPAAKPGTSAHEFGYAFDMVTSPYDALADVGYTWQQWGGLWGPGDPVHFQYPGFVPPSEGSLVDPSQQTGFWEQMIEGLPISFWPSQLLSLLGIPSSAKKTITPEQEAIFRDIAKTLPSR